MSQPMALPSMEIYLFLEEEESMVQMNSAVVGPISPLSIVGHEDVTVGGLEGSANLSRNALSKGLRDGMGDAGRREIAAALAIQRWYRALSRARWVGEALLAQEKDLDTIGRAFSSGSDGFDAVVQQLRNKEFNSAVGRLLSVALPPVSGKPATPSGQSNIRPFLTSLMIKLHPQDVLCEEGKATPEDGDFAAKLLCVAASSAVRSTLDLVQAVHTLANHQPGSGREFRGRLDGFVFAFRFINQALADWQAWDAPRRAMASMPMLVDALRRSQEAELTGQAAIAGAARQRVDRIKAAVAKLMGSDKAALTFQALETAIAGGEQFVLLPPLHAGGPPHRLELALGPARTTTPRSRPSTPTAGGSGSQSFSPSSGGGASPRTPRSTGPSPADAAAAGELEYEVVPIPSALAGLLRNEQLAHEIMVNPDFKIEDKQQDGFAELRAKMERLFWEQLIVSLTPSTQASTDDLTVGAVGQVRFHDDNEGAYYNARIDAVREDGQLEVTFLVDGERALKPASAFRLQGAPTDYTFLLKLIEEVREKLADLTPNRPDLARELHERLDTELMKQMLERGVMENQAMRGLFAYMVTRLTDLQAPARAEATKGWFQGVDAQAETALATHDIQAFVSLLPGLFKTLFDSIDETRRDIANAHVSMLRPFLTQHGVDYERQKFAERLRSGETSTSVVVSWLSESVAEQSLADPTLASTLLRGDAASHKRFLASALVSLLSRLGLPSTRLPETFSYDARRLVAARDELDRLTLVAVFSTLLRQFVSSAKLRMGPEATGDMEQRLYTLLQDAGSVKLPDLVEEVVSTCRRVFTACGSTLTEELTVTLRGVLAESAKPDNAVFRLLSTRLGEALALFVRNDVETGKDTVARYGFRPFESQIASAGTSLRRVLDHSVRVHGPMYSRLLLQHLQAQQQTQTSQAASNGSHEQAA